MSDVSGRIAASVFVGMCGNAGGAGTGDQARMTSVSFNITVRNGDTVWPSGGVGISDVNIYVYRDGKLEGSVFSGKTDKIGMQLGVRQGNTDSMRCPMSG